MAKLQPSRFTILVVDDEKNICRTLRMVLENQGYNVLEAQDVENAEKLLAANPVDLALLDIKLPGKSGLDLLEDLTKEYPDIPAIMISGHGTVADAVKATRLGAKNFLEKPLDRERVLLEVANVLEIKTLQEENMDFRREEEERFVIIGQSPAMQRLFSEIEKVAPTKGRVLITGESGTGKELVARSIHSKSPRSNGAFVKLNCAAIPTELIESELFGHERGAFSGAAGRKKGKFELADGGTLFLDEIGDMSLATQAKVLRVLQTGEFTRVGGERSLKADVRVIAATNKNLEDEIEQGRFREDLFFRLNVIPIKTPPLKTRKEDIPLLIEHFVGHFCRENNFRNKKVDPKVIERLQSYDWPGNVRELKNMIERLVIMSGPVITLADLPEPTARRRTGFSISDLNNSKLKDVREAVEKEYIKLKLEENNWNISKTADALGLERTNLHKKINQHGLKRPERT
ncbi:MAG: sigma-54-dependent Fis family transcriptional regulator [Deltaproteobacteria bacterium]|nr:sigma-54-dependent Fis family transcriptional regulator [Deltaproteobacteria bacterium]